MHQDDGTSRKENTVSERNELSRKKISVIGKIQAKAGHEAEVRGTFSAFVTPSRSEPGCLLYTLYEDKHAAGTFFTYEEWESEAALQTHLQAHKDDFERAKAMLEGDLQINVCQVVGMV